MGSIKGNQYTGGRMADCLNEIVSVALRRMVRLIICMPIIKIWSAKYEKFTIICMRPLRYAVQRQK